MAHLLLLRPPPALAVMRRRPPPPRCICVRRRTVAASASGPSRKSPSPTPQTPRSPPPPPPPTLARSSSSFSRLREIEVLHARWAMLGVSAILLSDSPALFSPAAWRDALDAAAASPPGAALAGGALASLAALEAARFWGSGEKDAEQRAYPATTARGNRLFDPLGLFRQEEEEEQHQKQQQQQRPPRLDAAATGRAVYAPWLRVVQPAAPPSPKSPLTRAELRALQRRELAAGRTAMAAFAGVAVACGLTQRGPLTLLMEQLSGR